MELQNASATALELVIGDNMDGDVSAAVLSPDKVFLRSSAFPLDKERVTVSGFKNGKGSSGGVRRLGGLLLKTALIVGRLTRSE